MVKNVIIAALVAIIAWLALELHWGRVAQRAADRGGAVNAQHISLLYSRWRAAAYPPDGTRVVD